MDPLHNLTALLIGTGEFAFSPNATTAAEAQDFGWIDFGNIVAFTPEPETTKEEHVGSYRGIRRADRTLVTQAGLRYKLRCDEWNKYNLQIAFGASTTTGHTQAALSAVAGEVLGFTAVPAVIGRWYDLKKADGTRLFNVTALTIATKVEGTDFILDGKLGRVRFLTAQAADLTPTITCTVITAGTDAAFLGLTPMADPVKAGFGRIYVYDQDDDNNLVWSHMDFSCEITQESGAEIDGTSVAEITLDVKVTDTVGTIYLRDANENAGL